MAYRKSSRWLLVVSSQQIVMPSLVAVLSMPLWLTQVPVRHAVRLIDAMEVSFFPTHLAYHWYSWSLALSFNTSWHTDHWYSVKKNLGTNSFQLCFALLFQYLHSTSSRICTEQDGPTFPGPLRAPANNNRKNVWLFIIQPYCPPFCISLSTSDWAWSRWTQESLKRRNIRIVTIGIPNEWMLLRKSSHISERNSHKMQRTTAVSGR